MEEEFASAFVRQPGALRDNPALVLLAAQGLLPLGPEDLVPLQVELAGSDDAQALVAALLNVASGNEWSCIADDLAAADAWLTENPIGTGGKGAWDVGQPIQQRLDDYNNGLLCATHRD